jgi:hypothetical protein
VFDFWSEATPKPEDDLLEEVLSQLRVPMLANERLINKGKRQDSIVVIIIIVARVASIFTRGDAVVFT